MTRTPLPELIGLYLLGIAVLAIMYAVWEEF